MKDAIVKEIREIRQQIEAEFDHDPDKYLKHVYRTQKMYGKRLVRRQSKLLTRHKEI